MAIINLNELPIVVRGGLTKLYTSSFFNGTVSIAVEKIPGDIWKLDSFNSSANTCNKNIHFSGGIDRLCVILNFPRNSRLFFMISSGGFNIPICVAHGTEADNYQPQDSENGYCYTSLGKILRKSNGIIESIEAQYLFLLVGGELSQITQYSSNIEGFSGFGNVLQKIIICKLFPNAKGNINILRTVRVNGSLGTTTMNNYTSSTLYVKPFLTISTDSLLFDCLGGTLDIVITTNDPNYTVKWKAPSFFHEGDYFQTDPPIVKTASGISVTLPETKSIRPGEGKIELTYGPDLLTVIINVIQLPAKLFIDDIVYYVPGDIASGKDIAAQAVITSNNTNELLSLDSNYLTPQATLPIVNCDTWALPPLLTFSALPKSYISKYNVDIIVKPNPNETFRVCEYIKDIQIPLYYIDVSYDTINPKYVSIYQNRANSLYVASSDRINFKSRACTRELIITTNNEGLKIKNLPSWLTSKEVTVGEKHTFTLTATDNTSTTNRTLKLDVVNGINYPLGAIAVELEQAGAIYEPSDTLVIFEHEANTKPFSIVSNSANISFSNVPSWLTITIVSHEGLKYIYSLVVLANPSTEQRNGSFSVTADGVFLGVIELLQKGEAEIIPEFILSTDNIISENIGGTFNVKITSNMSYTYAIVNKTLPDDNGVIREWFSVTDPSPKELSKTITITIPLNFTSTVFEGNIEFKIEGLGSRYLNITEKNAIPFATFTPNSQSVPYNLVNSWTSILRTNTSLEKFTESTGGNPNITEVKEIISVYPIREYKYTYTTTENKDSISLEYTRSYVSSVSKTRASYITTQEGNTFFKIEPSAPLNLTGEIQDLEFNIYFSDAWEINLTTDVSDWILITEFTGITGAIINLNKDVISSEGIISSHASFKVHIDKNLDVIRNGFILFKPINVPHCQLDFTLAVKILPSLFISPENLNLTSQSCTFDITIKSNSKWNLISTLPKWISANKVTGIGDDVIKITLLENRLLSRKSTLTFKTDDLSVTKACKIKQTGKKEDEGSDIEDGSDWGDRLETRIRDKYLKIRVRYKGDLLAIITGIKTLYAISNS